jgi:hypothetical protein
VGEVLTIGTVAEWDTVLILYDATGNEIARNDDDGPGLNALIEITLPEDGQ